MVVYVDDGSSRKKITNLSFAQTKQAAAVMDCIGRLIPQEGVDYDAEITFKANNSSSVSMKIIPKTDKGEKWRLYVMEMIRKYPPTMDYKGDVLEDQPSGSESTGGEDA